MSSFHPCVKCVHFLTDSSSPHRNPTEIRKLLLAVVFFAQFFEGPAATQNFYITVKDQGLGAPLAR